MGKPKASRKRVVKKKEEEVVDDVAVSDNDSAEEDKPAKNGNVENSEEDMEEDEHEVEEEVKGRRGGRGRPAAKAKKAAPKKPAAEAKKRSGRTTTPAPAKKSKKDESDEDPDKEYEVEKILEVRFRKGGKREFSIQWKGYGPKDATWEPEENLECEDLLDNFMTKLGNDDLSRTRRVSSRPSTIRSTRISETRDTARVASGRITKSSGTRTVVKPTTSVLDEFRKLNGESKLASSSNSVVKRSSVSKNNGVKTEIRRSSVSDGVRPQGGRSMMRAALLSCGMAVSIGAALLLSSSSTINWDGVQGDVYEFIHSLRHRLEDFAATATQQSQESIPV